MRHLLIAAIIFYLSGSPLHGYSGNDPWHYLEKGIKAFNVEQGFYMLHAFIPDRNINMDLLAQMAGCETSFFVTATGVTWPAGTSGWSMSRSGEPGYMLFRVGGSSLDDCRLLWEEIQQAVDCNGTACGFAWSVEAYAGDESSDLAAAGYQLLDRLGATMLTGNYYNGTLQILGHISWFNESVDLAEGSVNLDIELFYEPCRQQVRIRAGVPILITSISY